MLLFFFSYIWNFFRFTVKLVTFSQFQHSKVEIRSIFRQSVAYLQGYCFLLNFSIFILKISADVGIFCVLLKQVMENLTILFVRNYHRTLDKTIFWFRTFLFKLTSILHFLSQKNNTHFIFIRKSGSKKCFIKQQWNFFDDKMSHPTVTNTAS